MIPAHCGKESPAWSTGKAPPGWNLALGSGSDDPVFACSNACAANLNDARLAAGFTLWHWWHEDAPEPRDTSALELAFLLANASERVSAARDAACEKAKADLEWWTTTTWVILSYRPMAAC